MGCDIGRSRQDSKLGTAFQKQLPDFVTQTSKKVKKQSQEGLITTQYYLLAL